MRYRRRVNEGIPVGMTSYERVNDSPPHLPARLTGTTIKGTKVAGKRKKQRLKVVNTNCAAVDVGSKEHWVAVDPTQSAQAIRSFSTFTDDLQALSSWLKSLDVQIVAMEATGVYWIPLFERLDADGFDVRLVNSRATRQVSGRKSDVLDCQWIWQLISYGLLSSAFRPADKVCVLRSIVRQRATKVQERSRCIAHIQKALTQMNIQLDNVISDVMGKTGQRILRCIVAGERDPQKLATLRDNRVRASEETVARSLHGNWRQEHLFALAQAINHYDFLAAQIKDCDQQIRQALEELPCLSEQPSPAPTKRISNPDRTEQEQRSLHSALYAVMGVDLCAIPAISIETVLVLASEVGADLSRFASEKHFCSWLNLSPPTLISGGKRLSGRVHKVNNRAGQALRQAASTARNSQSYIGASHRARLTRMDKAKAIKATAHQLARLIYAMLTKGQEYVEKGIETFEQQSQDRQLRSLQRKASQFGLTLVESIEPTFMKNK